MKYITPIIETVPCTEEDILTLSVTTGSNPNNVNFIDSFVENL